MILLVYLQSNMFRDMANTKNLKNYLRVGGEVQLVLSLMWNYL